MKNGKTFATTIGPIYIAEEDGFIVEVTFGEKKDGVLTPLVNKAYQEIEEYLDGQRKTFDLPIKVSGTEFQKEAWRVISSIPYGETISYKQEAEKTGHLKAYRAIGNANDANTICILIPCHRVISHDGTLGGFGGGEEIKRRLLSIEKAIIAEK